MLNRTDQLYDRIISTLDDDGGNYAAVYGVPRGGSYVAAMLAGKSRIMIVDKLSDASHIVDDLIDGGGTRERTLKMWSGKRERHKLPALPFLFDALIDKPRENLTGHWVEFPWEDDADTEAVVHIERILQHLGEDVERPGLSDTPSRVVESWKELFSGYNTKPASVLKWFPEEGADEMVIVRGIRFFSTCEHHMLPFYGTADVGYIPDRHVVGLSKVARLVDACARKLQVQERLAKEIGEALAAGGLSLEPQHPDDSFTFSKNIEHKPKGVAVHLRGYHLCQMARGARQTDAEMETNFLTGAFRDEDSARAEFFSRIK